MPPVYEDKGFEKWMKALIRNVNDARISSLNAMAHNLNDQNRIFVIQDKLEEILTLAREECKSQGVST